MKHKTVMLSAALICLPLLFSGCGKQNSISIQNGSVSATVSSVNGSEVIISLSGGLGGFDFTDIDMPTDISGFGTGGEIGGEISGELEADTNIVPDAPDMPEGGDMPSGTPDPIMGNKDIVNPGGMEQMNTSTATVVLTISDTSVLYSDKSGTESAAALSDISAGDTITVSFDSKGNICKILVSSSMQMPDVSADQ